MAVEISPIVLSGNWDLGYALDVHIVESVALGEDVYGRPRFHNTRSPIGELLYQFKYNNKYDNLIEIVDTMKCFLVGYSQITNVDLILPVPPTNTFRAYQPTFEIARLLAKELKIFYRDDILEKQSGIESKELSADEKHKLQGTIIKKEMASRRHSVLLIDDLYQTGATLRECTQLLRQDPLVDKIYVLTITKTKNT